MKVHRRHGSNGGSSFFRLRSPRELRSIKRFVAPTTPDKDFANAERRFGFSRGTWLPALLVPRAELLKKFGTSLNKFPCVAFST
jgi:hypothetical protein